MFSLNGTFFGEKFVKQIIFILINFNSFEFAPEFYIYRRLFIVRVNYTVGDVLKGIQNFVNINFREKNEENILC